MVGERSAPPILRSNSKVVMGGTDKPGVIVGLGKRNIVNRFEPGGTKNFDEASIFYGNKEDRNLSAIKEGMGKYCEIVVDDARFANSVYAIRTDAPLADSMYSIMNDAHLAKSMYATRNEAQLADSMHAIRNGTRLADSMQAIRNDERLADSMHAIKIDPRLHAIKNDTRLADSMHAIKNDPRLADSMHAIRNDERFADSMHAIRNDARLGDSMHAIRNDARLADSMYVIRNDTRLADSVCANVYTIRNFNNGKDVQWLDGIRVSANCSVERKDRLSDMHEMEDHAGTFLKDGEERITFDRDNKLDEGSNLAGMIFMCNKKTKKDCFHHSLFGLPFNSWNLVKQVVPGTILFLFEYEARQMWGIYQAVSYGKININASAYAHSKGGSFPAQVRVREIKKFPPLEESEFKEAIRDNYFSDVKFEFGLSRDQVCELCEVFLQKTSSKHISSLDEENIHFDHSSGKVKENRDFVERSDEMYDLQGLMAEEYIPIESIQRESENLNEGQLHGFMSDYDLSEQFHPARMEYHHLYCDRPDKRHLQAKNDDVPCLEEENDLLLRASMYDFAEGCFSGRFLSYVSENKPDEFHDNANWRMYSPHNRKVYRLNGSNAEASSLVNDKTRPLEVIHDTFEHTPPSILDLTQPMYEHMLGEKHRNMPLAGLEPDVGEEGFRHVCSDRSKQKLSVWSRISGCDNLSLWKSRNRNTGNGWLYPPKHTMRPSTQDRSERFVTSEQKVFNGQNTIDCIPEEPTVSEQPEILIKFKRRKSFSDVCTSQELEKTHEKKRRKLVRPDFSYLSEAQDKGKDVVTTYNMEPQTEKQADLIRDKVPNINIVESGKHATHLNSVIIKQVLESGQTSTKSEAASSFKPSKREQNRSGCKELDSNGDTEPESNNQLPVECSGGCSLMEKDSKDSSERGAPLQKEAGTCGNVGKRQTDKIDDNRVKVSGGGILMIESVVKTRSRRADGNSDKLIGETNFGSDLDRLNASGEDVSEKNGHSLIDLNQPLCLSYRKTEDESISLIGDGDSCHNQISSASIAGNGNQNSPPHLNLELTMVPNSLLSSNSAEVLTGEISGQGLESCQF